MNYQIFEEMEKKYRTIEAQLASSDIIAHKERYQQLVREHAELKPTIIKFHELQKIEKEIENLDEIIRTGEHDLSDYAIGEKTDLLNRKQEVYNELSLLLNPPDPDDGRDIILEIRAGTGGNEASLFAGDLFRMYARYAERKRWNIDIIDSHPTGIGGFKEIIFSIQGTQVYRFLKYESGVHRVQRVPETEASGRIHTSTVTVAVLPEVEEKEVEIKSDDLRIDTFCSSGKGGQSVNKTLSAIRITHIPTGIVVQCQDERSQLKNKTKAMKVLMARVRGKAQNEQTQVIADQRKKQVGTGERSEKIRTYNFPQDRITDHRIDKTVHHISEVLDGSLDEIIQELVHNEKSCD